MSGKPTTPVSAPKIPKVVKLSGPTTPPSQKKHHGLTAGFLNTPEQASDQLPFSPGLKRTNSGTYKSPDYKLNSHNTQSPYTAVLKTPRQSGYDSDDNEEAGTRIKLQKTPQYLSPSRRLFTEDTSNRAKEDLSEITSQLKGKLTSALDKLQKSQPKPSRFDFTELSFNSETSPTKKVKHSVQRDLSKEDSIQRANVNLQQLTNPLSVKTKPGELQTSPVVENGNRLKNLPSPDEESSAHSALMAALSRQRKNDRKTNTKAPTFMHTPKSASESNGQMSLPPLNVALNEANEKNTEQDAVFSLMSLSSPQAAKFTHSRTHSFNNNSPVSSRSSSVILPSPAQSQPHTSLPPISRLMQAPARSTNDDNDATDVEEDMTDDDTESGIQS